MKNFIIRTMAAAFAIIAYYWLTFELIFKFDNYITVLAFPILVPIVAWIYDWDL